MLIVTFIRYPMHLHDHPSFLIQHKGFKREARYCPSRGLLPQRPWSGSQAENVQMYRFALSDFMGFLRHGWEPWIIYKEWEAATAASPGALFNAPHIRLSLGRLLPSRACLCFTGQERLDKARIVPPEIIQILMVLKTLLSRSLCQLLKYAGSNTSFFFITDLVKNNHFKHYFWTIIFL